MHRYSSQVQVEMFKLQSVICQVIVNLVFGANLNVSVMTSFILALIMLVMNMICKGKLYNSVLWKIFIIHVVVSLDVKNQ